MLRRLFPSLADAATAPLRRGPLAHRPIAKRDVEHLRWAGQGGWVMPGDNPGIRIEPAFVSEAEGSQIAAELDAAASAYGYPYDGEARVHLVSAGSGEIEASLATTSESERESFSESESSCHAGKRIYQYTIGYQMTPAKDPKQRN